MKSRTACVQSSGSSSARARSANESLSAPSRNTAIMVAPEPDIIADAHFRLRPEPALHLREEDVFLEDRTLEIIHEGDSAKLLRRGNRFPLSSRESRQRL